MKRKRIYALTVAVLSSLAMPLTGAAEDSPYLATAYSYYQGTPFAEFYFLREGQGIGKEKRYLVEPSLYDLSEFIRKGTVDSMSYWTDMLGPGTRQTTPWQIFVNTFGKQSAEGITLSLNSDGKIDAYASIVRQGFFLADKIQEGDDVRSLSYEEAKADTLANGIYAFGNINIGKYLGAARSGAVDGWWLDTDTVLTNNEQATDFAGTVRHELGHALGIVFNEDGENGKYVIDPYLEDQRSWTLHLVDQNGNPAKAGLPIVTSAEATDPSKSFVVDEEVTPDGKGYLYFVGDHVTEVLDGAKFFGRSALPVNGWEEQTQKGQYKFEGSHLQTAGMMSHRDYSNYTTFLEVELAVLQDLGYQFDRKAYFGRSIYGNGGTIVNNQGFFQRNAEGSDYLDNTYSVVPLGVGLHIYGSNNTVTQNANILTIGTGAVGVRVDGTGNTLIVPAGTEIHADGRRGNGLMVTYGNGHTIEQAGTITALGEGGTAVRFDFGSSSNGARDEYRGSYIRYIRTVNTDGKISAAENLSLTIDDADTYNANKDELKGALIDNYNLSGTLAGNENAIYIGKNAFVKEININEGASIQGNITSDWKHFGEAASEGCYNGVKGKEGSAAEADALKIQYKGTYNYDAYIPDLVTNLNFNTDIYYDGNIAGVDNMKVNVQSGTLTYEGNANVVNVQVAEDAALFGGTYTVNDMSSKQHADFPVDDTTGYLISSGTIGASAADKNMTINGKLVSNGNLQAYGGGEGGQIVVNGEAHIDKSTVTAYNMLPGEQNKPVLTADSIAGTITNADIAVPVTGMLNAQGKISGNTITVDTMAANNLQTTDTAVNKTYDAVMNMYNGLGEGKYQQGELRKLFSLAPETAAKALTDISSPNAVYGMTMTQTNTVTSHILSTRLAEAYAMNNIDVRVPVSNLADDKDSTVNEGLKLQAKVDLPVENNIWFKTAKNWGELKGGANYHGTTFALGYDKAVGRNWRVGGFVSYGNSSFAAGSASSTVQDTRLGVYAGYKRGPHEGYVYLNHGWLKHDLSRGITGIGTAKADYNSRILELGGEYKYDLQANKVATWHVSPYVNMQLSHLWQDGYTENGVGVLGQRVNSAGNTYFAAGLGVEFKRYLNRGSYAMRLGVKHAFSGANPRVTFGLVGGGASVFEMRGQQDKTHLVMSISGETEFKPGWSVSGDAVLARGSHDRDIMCAVTLRRMW
ncbi:autotransporter outer membrane beta-barrel domain-containing protein [Selenomonas ruminantium]|uniref:Uncharacterized conserved protein, contains a C-terminal beta-barrel porin domain n=1 Tax=Selenomonas ruminantium TaxID=971 RepID=A0A1H3VTR3_SELRU|nr:autotransporter outer membrane beta-barrel domain-containing protein [Selenomonas ruminantium]SDZ78081.1 Uncharacterized conserved protein, contains a C-terminal beta-barrel porin domain [Selenomonas ruminantium]